jgi:ABC-type branched-subunit amino acid transport system ATPase component
MELFESLSVAENVALGVEGPLAGANPWRHVFGKRSDRRRISEAAAQAMELCDIQDLAGLPAGVLSTGQRRLVELARCLAGPSELLLLDEPSSGLNRTETARFGNILRNAVAERGLGILLVEHDMPLVMDICDHINCLDFGNQIFAGAPAEVQASPVVRAAYLGEREVEDVVAVVPPNRTDRSGSK